MVASRPLQPIRVYLPMPDGPRPLPPRNFVRVTHSHVVLEHDGKTTRYSRITGRQSGSALFRVTIDEEDLRRCLRR